ncbi:MAG: hypothetical protein IAG10_31800, partial [Planctomycetaceae bacterium]|nr:hypothetical protein [Planctomycetaceae bacterium]
MTERQHVLDEARRLIEKEGVIGEGQFQKLTQLSPCLWNGEYWEKFGDVVRELGYEPIEQTKPLPYDTICRALAE